MRGGGGVAAGRDWIADAKSSGGKNISKSRRLVPPTWKLTTLLLSLPPPSGSFSFLYHRFFSYPLRLRVDARLKQNVFVASVLSTQVCVCVCVCVWIFEYYKRGTGVRHGHAGTQGDSFRLEQLVSSLMGEQLCDDTGNT